MYEELVKQLRKWKQDYYLNEEHEKLIDEAADAIDELQKLTDAQLDIIKQYQGYLTKPHWIPVEERLPDCFDGEEIGNVEWISHGTVYAGCFGRGGKWRDAYFRTWNDDTEGIDAKDAEFWRIVTLPEPPKEVRNCDT